VRLGADGEARFRSGYGENALASDGYQGHSIYGLYPSTIASNGRFRRRAISGLGCAN